MNNNSYLNLPTRDFLRQLIGQNYVKASELKTILRKRGVFCSTDDKKLLGSILITSGISAEEYLFLKETYKSKEDNPKIRTRKMKWASDVTLFDALDEDFDYDAILNDDFGNVRLLKVPQFYMVDDKNPDLVRIDIDIERRDITKNWGDDTSIHKGYIEFNKNDASLDIQVTLCHTSKEVKDFCDSLTEMVTTLFKKQKNLEEDLPIVMIRFHDFDNTGRVNFLYDLSNEWRINELYFKDTKDLQFSPEKIDEKTPDNLKWMKDTIEDLKLKGSGIHSTFFFKNKDCHKYIKLYKISCDYSFAYEHIEGICRVNYEFHDVENKNSELSVDISNFSLTKNDNGENKDKIKLMILKNLDRKKVALYEKHAIRRTPSTLKAKS